MKLANVMRSVGVRRENAFKNINKDKVVCIFKFAPPNAGDSVRFQCFTVEPATWSLSSAEGQWRCSNHLSPYRTEETDCTVYSCAVDHAADPCIHMHHELQPQVRCRLSHSRIYQRSSCLSGRSYCIYWAFWSGCNESQLVHYRADRLILSTNERTNLISTAECLLRELNTVGVACRSKLLKWSMSFFTANQSARSPGLPCIGMQK